MVHLQVGCSRCRHTADLTFATAAVSLPSEGPGSPAPTAAAAAAGGPVQGGKCGGLEWAGECANCHASWAVQLAPRLVHERSNALAAVRAEGCVPRDLLPSMLAGQCGRWAGAGMGQGLGAGARAGLPWVRGRAICAGSAAAPADARQHSHCTHMGRQGRGFMGGVPVAQWQGPAQPKTARAPPGCQGSVIRTAAARRKQW